MTQAITDVTKTRFLAFPHCICAVYILKSMEIYVYLTEICCWLLPNLSTKAYHCIKASLTFGIMFLQFWHGMSSSQTYTDVIDVIISFLGMHQFFGISAC